MTLNQNHILGLISDILKNCSNENPLSYDEQSQIKELACQLQDIGVTDVQLSNVLNSIHQNNFNNISNYTDEELAEWLSILDQNIIT